MFDKELFTTSKKIWGEGQENHDPIPKIIWIYWEGTSEIVKRCISKLYSLQPDFEINILNNHTLKDFLFDIPSIKSNLPLANYADLVRLGLLSKYGGIWMDASILLTENLDWVYYFKKKYFTDVIGFYSDILTNNKDYPILETWFLATPKNNYFITKWYELYKECYTSDYPFQFFKDLIIDKEKIQGIDENLSKYLICYLAAMQIMLEDNNYKILMFPASETAHYYNFNLKLKPHQLCKVFLFDKAEQIYPKLIKFEKRGRVAIDTAIEQGQYSKKSLLFRLSPDDRYYSNKFPRYVNYVMFIISNFKKKYLKND